MCVKVYLVKPDFSLITYWFSCSPALDNDSIASKAPSTHEHGQQCSDCWGEEGIRGLYGHGKKYSKY